MIEFIFALMIAIVTESIVFYLLGFQKIKDIMIISIINLITNPIVNLTVLVFYHLEIYSFYKVIMLETIVVLVEGFILFKKYTNIHLKKAFLISALMNSCSYLAGIVISKII